MKKFNFRLATVMRQRQIERDIAQRDHAVAAAAVREQLAKIQKMYKDIDDARLQVEQIQLRGGNCSLELISLEGFVVGQKFRIVGERKIARELMAVEEEKLEILTQKMQDFKILEKLKEKKKEEHKIEKNKKLTKQMDDNVTMRFVPEGDV